METGILKIKNGKYFNGDFGLWYSLYLRRQRRIYKIVNIYTRSL
jgi:hypothetical protein